jgi:hypothetical protein
LDPLKQIIVGAEKVSNGFADQNIGITRHSREREEEHGMLAHVLVDKFLFLHDFEGAATKKR